MNIIENYLENKVKHLSGNFYSLFDSFDLDFSKIVFFEHYNFDDGFPTICFKVGFDNGGKVEVSLKTEEFSQLVIKYFKEEFPEQLEHPDRYSFLNRFCHEITSNFIHNKLIPMINSID